jgi:NADPH:quinone reductase-like Zn-dependent oxidoreductase
MRDHATNRFMQALWARTRGGADQLVCETAPLAPLGIGDVLVRVHVASFTPNELVWPSTWVDRLGRDRTPVIPAHELSGWWPRSAGRPA